MVREGRHDPRPGARRPPRRRRRRCSGWDELGQVAPGFLADLVAVEGDPLADINVVIIGVKWVMKGGKVVVDAVKR